MGANTSTSSKYHSNFKIKLSKRTEFSRRKDEVKQWQQKKSLLAQTNI